MATEMRVETLKEAENITTLQLVKWMGQETMNSYVCHLELPEPLQRHYLDLCPTSWLGNLKRLHEMKDTF
jgi:hypothetical protein